VPGGEAHLEPALTCTNNSQPGLDNGV